jgi:hypothetical protein
MEEPLRLNQSLGEIGTESGVFELLATAEATYDRRTGAVVVMLNSFLQLHKAKRARARLFADSILGRMTVSKPAAKENYAELVHSIFENWVHCLEQTTARRSEYITPAGARRPAATDVIALPS